MEFVILQSICPMENMAALRRMITVLLTQDKV